MWKRILLPLAAFCFFLALYGIWRLVDLPPEETLIELARAYFNRYGMVTVFVGSVLEGLLLIGWYFPGAIVFFTALVLAGADVLQAGQVAIMAASGLLIGYVTNFFLGKYGWYRLLVVWGLEDSLQRARERLERHGLTAIFSTYWQPNLASLISTSAGILQFGFTHFFWLSVAATLLWIGFWSSLVYFLGPAAMALVGVRAILILLAGWIAVRLILNLRARRAGTEANSGQRFTPRSPPDR